MGTIPTFLRTKVLLFCENKEEKWCSLSIKHTSLWGKLVYSSRESTCRPAGRQPCTHLPAGIALAPKL